MAHKTQFTGPDKVSTSGPGTSLEVGLAVLRNRKLLWIMSSSSRTFDLHRSILMLSISTTFQTAFPQLRQVPAMAINAEPQRPLNSPKSKPILSNKLFKSLIESKDYLKIALMASVSLRRIMATSISNSYCQFGLKNRVVGVPRVPRRSFVVSASNFANENREFVIVGGGNAAGYAARTFVEHGMADGRLCIVSKEAFAPYERPALTKGYLFPLDKKPARLPGFHTCVGAGGDRQDPEWYQKHGIEVLYKDPVVSFDSNAQTVVTSSGKRIKYGSLIISTGAVSSRFPEKIGGDLPGVHYIRDVADADSLISSLQNAKKVAIIGGGYIGMEVAAAATGWNLDTTIIFPEDHIMSRLFTPSIAHRYEELYQSKGVNIMKGSLIEKLEAGTDGRVARVLLKNGTVVEADTVIVGIGAKPAVSPFGAVGLNSAVGGIQVDSLFRTSVPGIFAIGDVAAFPLKIYNRMTRVEHVDHARKSAQHCVKTLLTAHTESYDYLPYFYSRVFEYEGSTRKVWWQFYGDNVGETVEIGNFDPKIATFWIDSGISLSSFLIRVHAHTQKRY
ncbi:Monodehydroascorbate reductase [Rhynchospora pubera]|uniref:monodehydroascorbate reductase (NADH) n=1 Tax=Rhynchospora pubera TaxID=906938 RepID=A0AAV8EX74_9POAL|nr:Monodehydroascorbate reductase [Rhynchospora pubera]